VVQVLNVIDRPSQRNRQPRQAEDMRSCCASPHVSPIQTFKLLRTLGRHMKLADILRLLSSPFRKRTLNRKPELPGRMVDLGLSAPVRNAGSITTPAVPA
jgi:hypothetical protein